MFAPERVEERLDGFEKEFGYRPRPHSLEDVENWCKRLAEVIVEEKNGDIMQVRKLNKAEERFIANERGMCAASCHYFLTRYYFIKFKNKIGRFVFRQGQWILWQMLCELDRMGVSKMLQILKARQLGISTLAEGIATWCSLFIPGVAAQIGSADGQKTQIMLGMMTLAIDQLPPWLPPTQTRAKTASDRALLEFSRIGSLIMVQPGSIRGGMGQGTTPTFVHLSEISQYTNPVQQLDEGLFKALHEGPELVVLLESTGDASHRSAWWWKEQWIANRDNYWSGGAKFLPVFLPWHTTPELYPGDAWLKKFPMPAGFTPNDDTVDHVRRAEAYVRMTPMLSKIMGTEWCMPMTQQWFWEFNHEDHKRRRVEKSWYRQMPCVTGDTLVSTERGIMPIANAKNAHRCESGPIAKMLFRGEKPTLLLTTKDGRLLRGTKEHLIRLHDDSWKALGELRPSDAVKLSVPMFAESVLAHEWNDTPIYKSRRVIDEDMGRLLGYFMGDGSFHAQELTIACDAKDGDTIADVTSLIARISGREPRHQRIGEMVRVRSSYQYWLPFLQSIGAIHPVIHSTQKRPDGMRRKICVPACILQSPRPVIRQFLRGLYECDGHAYKRVPRVVLYSAYDELLTGVQLLLLGFGIRAQFMKQKKISGASVKGGKRHEYIGRELVIRSAWANQFYDLIGFAGSRKQNSGKRRLSEKYADAALVDEVFTVEETGQTEAVYDLSVSEEHRFGANGIEVHNCDDYEALLGENDKVYSQEAIEVVNRTVEKLENTPVYMLVGDDIAERREPDESRVWYGEDAPPRLKTNWLTKKGTRLDWMFVPLKPEPEKSFDPLEKFLMWEQRLEGYDYSIGWDTGTGVGGDRTVGIVTRHGSEDEPDVQVAEFASDSVPAAEISAYIAALAALYSPCLERPHPKLCIEMKRKFGDLPYHMARQMGFNRWHQWGHGFDRKTFRDHDMGKHARIGWFTNEWSRPLLLSAFQYAVENGWYIVKSKWLAEELKNLEQKTMPSGKTRVDHDSGGHDDRVFGGAQSYWTLHQADVMIERAKKRYEQPKNSDIFIETGPSTSTIVIPGRAWYERRLQLAR